LSLLEVRPTYIIAFHGAEGKVAADKKVAEPHTANRAPPHSVHIAYLCGHSEHAVPTAVLYPWDPTEDRLFGLEVRVPGYRSRGPGSVPCATTFSEKYLVYKEVHSAS
jgi:hypothetical protein